MQLERLARRRPARERLVQLDLDALQLDAEAFRFLDAVDPRDIKSENILLQDGQALVADFRRAKRRAGLY